MSNGQLLKQFLSTAIPASLGSMLGFSQDTINLIYAGSLNNPIDLAAICLATVFVNIIGIAFFVGFNGALETLVSQARGAQDFKQCGVYLQRGRFINICLSIFILFPLYYSKSILQSLGQDPRVVEVAADYIIAISPGIFFLSQFDIQRRFLI